MRVHLASLVEDFRAHGAETAVVTYRGIRRYAVRYDELAAFAGRFAAELDRRDIAPGERVVLWGANSAEWIGVFFGCLLRAVVAVPLDAAGAVGFAGRVIADVRPRLVVGDAALLRTLRSDTPTMELARLREELPEPPNYTIAAAVREEAPFQILFTSGTTSEPRGIVHTHRNVLASLLPIEREITRYRRLVRLVHPLRFLHTLPLSHVFGQFMGLWVPALLAAQLHLADTQEPGRLTEMIHRERISVLVAVPRVLDLLRGHLLRRLPRLGGELSEAAPSSVLRRWWRFRSVHRLLGWKFWAAVSGGAALPPELERFWNQMGYALIQGYGMTETAALITLNHPFRVARGTVGRALPGREVRLSETGEILVRGDMVATATWQEGAMRPREDEWLATGDLAEQTPQGDLRFLGRSGDTIVTASGLNVHPADIEAALLTQPGVSACTVVPCSFAAGPEPVCAVIFSGDAEALAAAVATANGTLAQHQQIRRVVRWPDVRFPTTSTGKLLRRTVREWVCAQQEQSRATAAGAALPEPDTLLDSIAEITGEPPGVAGDGARLSEDLHLDSLGRVQLHSALEHALGLEIREETVASSLTLGDLRQAIRRAQQPAEAPAEARRAAARAGDRDGLFDASDRSFIPAVPGSSSSSGRVAPISADEDASLDLSFTQSGAATRHAGHAARTHVYPRWPWSRPAGVLRILFQELVARPLIALLLAPRVTGADPARLRGPLLVISNHVTLLDGALVLYALPARVRRSVAIAMSGEMLLDFRSARAQGSPLRNLLAPAAYWLLTALYNVFPLPRRTGIRASFAHAGAAMDRGLSVLVFPEGTRSRDGRLGRFQQGIGLLAQQAEISVLPVALVGLDAMRSARSRWFRSGRLEVRLGAPVAYASGLEAAEWTRRLEQEMRRLLEAG